jgi:hypothetical protein
MLGTLAEELPVCVVLGFGEDDAFARNQLGCSHVAIRARNLHRVDERAPDMPHDCAAWCLLSWVQSHDFADFLERSDVVPRLFQVLLPLAFEIGVHGARDRRDVHLDSAFLVLERLQYKLFDLFSIHEFLLQR